MTAVEFDTSRWTERVAASLTELARAQGPYLEEYWQDYPRRHVTVDGQDVTPYPLDDVRSLYSQVRYAKNFGSEAHYEPLRAVYDGARHALLSHPELERAAARELDAFLLPVGDGRAAGVLVPSTRVATCCCSTV